MKNFILKYSDINKSGGYRESMNNNQSSVKKLDMSS